MNSDAIEIKVGQGTKPGMDGHLLQVKSLENRGKPLGENIIFPSVFEGIDSKKDLKDV